MSYEIDFLGLNEKTDDADAIALRWRNGDSFIVGVVDGGFAKHGDAMVDHLNKYYFDDIVFDEDKIVDFVVCSHPDQDHASGLKKILENFQVKALYMNRSWEHIDALYDKVSDGRITKKSLKEHLKNTYKYVAEIEEIAIEKNIPIYDVFEGCWIEGKIEVLSPSREFYLNMIVEDNRTPLSEDSNLNVVNAVQYILEKAQKLINWISEAWDTENLREDETTTPINETSTVLLGHMDEEIFLLTGDAGIRGLNNAMDYAENNGVEIKKDVKIYQIPHHGGRHNVSTTLLDRMLGEKVKQGTTSNKFAYVMAGKDSDHPKKVVTNAYIRRGLKIYEAKGNTIHHYMGDMPDRHGWSSATATEFSDKVEAWDD